MTTIRQFQDIEAWQKARELTRLVYEFSGRGRFGKDFGLRDQIRRAAMNYLRVAGIRGAIIQEKQLAQAIR